MSRVKEGTGKIEILGFRGAFSRLVRFRQMCQSPRYALVKKDCHWLYRTGYWFSVVLYLCVGRGRVDRVIEGDQAPSRVQERTPGQPSGLE